MHLPVNDTQRLLIASAYIGANKMNRIWVVAGASGAGKSFLLENVRTLSNSLQPVTKLTTRAPRPYENDHLKSILDLEFNRTQEEILNIAEYRYRYINDVYGIRKADL